MAIRPIVDSRRPPQHKSCCRERSDSLPPTPLLLLLLLADLLTRPVGFLPPLLPVPPVEGRPRFLCPRGIAVPVRRAVCCFWPAIVLEF